MLLVCARSVCVNRIHIENLCVARTVDGCKIRSTLKPSGSAKRRLVDGWWTGHRREFTVSPITIFILR